MASPLPVGDFGVRMRNDGHEPDGAEEQRPARIPVDPVHCGYSRNPPYRERAGANLGCLGRHRCGGFFHPWRPEGKAIMETRQHASGGEKLPDINAPCPDLRPGAGAASVKWFLRSKRRNNSVAGEAVFIAPRRQAETNARYQHPRSNNEVRSCGISSSG